MVEMTSKNEINLDVSTSIAETKNEHTITDSNISVNLVEKKNKFETEVINAYIKLQSKAITNVIDCENALKDAIDIIAESKNDKTIHIIVNNIILDRLKRICQHKALTLSLLVGKIYISLSR